MASITALEDALRDSREGVRRYLERLDEARTFLDHELLAGCGMKRHREIMLLREAVEQAETIIRTLCLRYHNCSIDSV